MSKTLAQIFALNPATTILNNDLFYLVQSPYTPGADAAITGATLKSLFLLSANNLSDLTNPTAARANLGLTALATASPPLSSTLGGTGVNNGSSTFTIGGNFALSGAFSFTGTLTGITTVTFPTAGTLATTSQLPVPAALTKVDDTNVTLTLGGTPATALLQPVSLTLGWTGTLSSARGGTGVNNGVNTITLGGNIVTANSFTTVGNFAVTQTYTGITNVTFPTTGTLATTSQLPTFPITLAQGGTNASLVASNGGIFYSTATAGAILSGTATARQMLQSGATAAPAWSTATWPATTTANAVLFSSATNVVGEITSAASAVLITSAGSVPSFSQTLPSAVQTNITALGAQSQALNMNSHQINNLTAGVAATDAANVGQVTAASSPLTTKGDLYTFTTVNARLPVGTVNGQFLQVNSAAATGLSWSTATLPSTATNTGRILRADGTNWVQTTSTFADTYAASSVLYANGANNVAGLATANNGVLITSGAGVPSISSTLPNAVQDNITRLGTVTVGVWNGTVITGTFGGTGVNNGASTFTMGGSVTFSGAFTFTGTLTGNTSVTFPTSGTLLTSASINAYECQGRLTLTTGAPVTTADVLAATTLYFTPYVGDHISLFDGASTWTTLSFTQISIAVPATTNTMYDVYIFNSGGTATLELTAWTNDTTRAIALTTQNGVYVKTGVTTRRYVGSFRTTGSSGQTEDSLVKRYLWNYYNRTLRSMRATDSTDTWNYSTATFRQANANTANQLDFVIGVSEDTVYAVVSGRAVNSISANRIVAVGVGLDSTTVNSAGIKDTGTSSNATIFGTPKAWYDDFVAVGRHTLVWLEIGAGTDTQTWQGDNGAPTLTQFGIQGFLRG